MVTSWDFNNKNGGLMGYIPSKHGDFMGFQWDFNGISIGSHGIDL
jgi:hypothetical protein